MPAYLYRCPSCGEHFTQYFRFEEDSSTAPCEKCGGRAVKVFQPSPVHLKGSGWGSK